MQDSVFIYGLTAHTIIGAWEWEKHLKRKIVFDLQIGTDVNAAAASDKLSATVDYQAVSERIIQFTEESRFQLVETLAEEVAHIVINEFGAPWVKLKLEKVGAVGVAKAVGIEILRKAN